MWHLCWKRALWAALLCQILTSRCVIAQDSGTTEIIGRIGVPEGLVLPADTEIVLTSRGSSSRRFVTFPSVDGSFKFKNIPKGIHSLEVYQVEFNYPTYTVDTTQTDSIQVNVYDIPGIPPLPYPMVLRPISKAEYFEKKQPFDIVGFIKTPYGMMLGFLVFSLVVLPRLKVDPEEYKQMLEEKDKLIGKASTSTNTNPGKKQK